MGDFLEVGGRVCISRFFNQQLVLAGLIISADFAPLMLVN